MYQLGIGLSALQDYDLAMLVCDNILDLMCVFISFTGIDVISSASVYSAPGLQRKLWDGPLRNEKAWGFFSNPNVALQATTIHHHRGLPNNNLVPHLHYHRRTSNKHGIASQPAEHLWF